MFGESFSAITVLNESARPTQSVLKYTACLIQRQPPYVNDFCPLMLETPECAAATGVIRTMLLLAGHCPTVLSCYAPTSPRVCPREVTVMLCPHDARGLPPEVTVMLCPHVARGLPPRSFWALPPGGWRGIGFFAIALGYWAEFLIWADAVGRFALQKDGL